MLSRSVFLALALELVAASAHNHPGEYSPEDECSGVNAISPACSTGESLHYRDIFYVGGHYVETTAGNLTYDQLYVEKLTPADRVSQPNPVIFFHGGGTSGVTWLNTPDNRKGFASYFLDLGYQVYIVDQTSVGRGTEEDLTDFPMRIGSTAEISENGFTAPEQANLYPQSQLHTQWPGTGLKSDPTFDAFESTFIPLTSNLTAQELSMRRSGCALLALLETPSFLVSHSIGALHPLLLSNDCPALVAGSVNLEPANTPFQSLLGNASVPGTGSSRTRPWGLANTRLTYDPAPPSSSSSENDNDANDVPAALGAHLVGVDAPAKRACYMQSDPPRTLPQVAKVPYVALTAEASPHATYDHCVVDYLRQAGVRAEWIRLADDAGVRGNAHFMHLERNNWQVAGVVHAWMQRVVVEGAVGGTGGTRGGDGGKGEGWWGWLGWW